MGDSTQRLWQRLLAGDDLAPDDIFRRYVDRLLALVRQRLSPRLRPRLDAEDVVQSVWRTFFVRAKRGEFTPGRNGALWGLLAAIAVHKVHGAVERHTAAKRDARRDTSMTGAGSSWAVPDRLDREPSPAVAAMLVEEAALALREAGPAARDALELHLAGKTTDEIAALVGRTPRTVRRTIERLREMLAARLRRTTTPGEAPRPRYEGDHAAPLDFHDYVLHEFLGSGGMGKAYRATRRSDGATVAVKTLRKGLLLDSLAIDAFLREAALAVRLTHPGIARVYGAGRYPGGGYFLALEYIAGETLQALIDRGPLAISTAVGLVDRAAEAIQFAHARGVLHCDLKPANILLAQGLHGERTPRLVDFGLARRLGRTAREVATPLGGTLAFMAPEQLAPDGEPDSVLDGVFDERTDVFGLGGVLHACLTGRAPFEGRTLRQRLASRSRKVISVRRRRAEIPPALAAVVSQAMAPRRDARFGSVAEFRQAIAHWKPNG